MKQLKRIIACLMSVMMMIQMLHLPISQEIKAEIVSTNIALSKESVVSGVEVAKFKKDYLTDGNKPVDISNPTTEETALRWSSNQTLPSTPVWAYVDLGSSQTFSQINLYWQKADGTDFDIQISDDATEWETIKTITADVDQVGRVDEISFDEAQSARYVRIYVRKGITSIRSDVKGVSLFEIEIIQNMDVEAPEDESENLALNKTAVSNGCEANTSFIESKAVDGLHPEQVDVHDTSDPNYPSRWSSLSILPETPVWLYVDLGVVRPIAEVDIYWQKANASIYQIQVSNDAQSWDTVMEVNYGEEVKPRLDQNVLPTTAIGRYVRVYATSHNGEHKNIGIYELEVYSSIIYQPPASEAITELLENAEITIENEKIVLPTYEGWTFSLYGSNNQQVIDLAGNIHRPYEDMNVSLILQAQSDDGEETVIGSKNYDVLVKAQSEKTQEDNAKPSVLPALREWKGSTGTFEVTSDTKIAYQDATLRNTAVLMQGFFAQMLHQEIEISETADENDIVFVLNDTHQELGKEGYIVEIKDNVRIIAPTTKGLLYGAVSITQILYQDDGYDSLPKGIIRDYPMYPVRACMLDVGRMYFPIEYVEEIAIYMSWYKLNELHLGTNNSRVQTGYTAFRLEVDDEYIQPIVSTDGSYNKVDYKAFQQSVDKYGIDIITEIDTPAHSGAFANIEDGKLMMDFNHLDLRTQEKYDAAISVVKKIIDEYLGESIDDPNRVIQEDVFHIGTDEYPSSYLTQYKNYTADLINYVTSKGYKVRLWGSFADFNHPDNPIDATNATINQWSQSWAKAKVCMDHGFNIINTLYNYLYIVPGLKGYSAFLPLESRYTNWDATNYGAEQVLKGEPKNVGAEFCVWMDTSSYNGGWSWFDAFDRFINGVMLISEKTWYGEKTADQSVEDFMNRVETLSKKVPNANPTRQVDSQGQKVLSYDFNNEDHQVLDGSGNEYHGNLLANATLNNGTLNLDGTSSLQTPLTSIGHPYTVAMDVKMDEDCGSDATLMTSKDGTLHVNPNGNLTFTRQYGELTGYVFEFEYQLPVNTWVNLAITCDGTNTYLLVDGVESYMAVNKHPNITFDNTKLNEIDSTTFVAGIAEIGKGFKGNIDNVIIANEDSTLETYANLYGEDIYRVYHNLAYQKDAYANGNEVDYLTPDLATDGLRPSNSYEQDTSDPNWSSRWSSKTTLNTTPVWIYVDFSEATTFDKIDIYWQKAKASEYEIQISDDASEWETILSVTKPEENTAPRPDFIQLEEKATARYLRIYATKNNGEHKNVGIFEIEVYDSSEFDLPILNDEAYAIYQQAKDLLEHTQKESVNNDAYATLEASYTTISEAIEEENRFVISKNWTQFKYDIQNFIDNYDAFKVVNVKATANTYKSIQLSWDEVAKADAYVIERLTSQGEWLELATTNTNTYLHDKVKTGKEYTYRIYAKNNEQIGSYSNEISAMTTLEGEVKLTITNHDEDQFNLSWTSVEGATRYIIYRKNNDDVYKKILTLGKDVRTYTTKAMAEGTYTYQVKAARYDSIDRVMTQGSNEVEVSVGSRLPNLQMSQQDDTTITLTWDKVVGMNTYMIYRATSENGTYRLLKKVMNTTSIQTSCKEGMTYYYKLRAYKVENGVKVYSPYSNIVSAQ